MAGKYGPASAWVLVDGYDLTGSGASSMRHKEAAPVTDTTGLNQAWRTRAPIGVKEQELEIQGTYWDTDTNKSHAALSAGLPGSPQATARIVTFGLEGDVAGSEFFGVEGAFQADVEVLASSDDIQRVNATFNVTGQTERGVILQPLAVKTADWDTETTAQYDGGAQSTAGGVAYMQVTAFSGFTGFVGTVRDSSDDITYGDLVAFDDVTAGPTAQRKTVAGNVERYLAFDGNVTGTGSITVWAGFSRTA